MPQSISGRASELAGTDRAAAVAELVALAEGSRDSLTSARQRFVRRLHDDSSDFEATAALSLLNAALAEVGPVDPYSWKHRRRP